MCETSHKHTPEKENSAEPSGVNLSSYNYQKADWKKLKSILRETNWENLLKDCNTSDQKIQVIMDIVYKVVDENCIKFKERKGKTIKNIPRDRRILLRKKKKLKVMLKNRKMSNDRKETIEKIITDIDVKLLSSHRNERMNEELTAIRNIKANPKHFFTYAKKHMKTKSSIGPFRIGDNLITDLEEISQKLSEQYTSSFSTPDLTQDIGDPKDFSESQKIKATHF